MDELWKKAEAAMDLIRRAAMTHPPGKAAFAWSGGKDSTLLLFLARRALGCLPFPVLFIDTGREFAEVLSFRDALAKEWGLALTVLEGGEGERAAAGPEDPALCCRLRKSEPLARAIREMGLSALATAVRADEHPARAGEKELSYRDDPPHVRIHPLLSFTEKDVWALTEAWDVPFCPLYLEGYRSLGCAPCTEKPRGLSERSGRDPEKERLMKNLRDLGYF